MATPTNDEILTLEEYTAIRDALANHVLMNGLRKVLAYDERFHAETMEIAALAPQVDTNAIIKSAAQKRSAREMLKTISDRVEQLKPGKR